MCAGDFSLALGKRCFDARPLRRSLIDCGRPRRLGLAREPTLINREIVRFTDDERPFDYVLQFAIMPEVETRFSAEADRAEAAEGSGSA